MTSANDHQTETGGAGTAPAAVRSRTNGTPLLEPEPVPVPRSEDGSARGGMFRSLRTRNYRLFVAGQVVSNTGTWMQRVAQDWLVLDLTHGSGTALGITTALQFLPMLLFGLWGGVLADRYPKRRLLVLTQVAMGGLALVLGVLAVTGTAQVWQVYLLSFGLGMATVVDNPARQAFVVEMVGRGDLPNAVALNSATFNGARMMGPAIAGVLISIMGTGPVFLINAVSVGAVIAGLAAMRVNELHVAEPVARAKGQLREGLRYVRGRRDLKVILIMVFFVATFGMNFQITTALVAREVFHTGASSFGLASTMLAVGAVIGALLAARRVRPDLRLALAAAGLFGVLEMATGLMPAFWMFLVLLVPTGIALMTFTTSANALMQLSVAPEMRGRVMALYMFVFLGTNPVGAPLVGWISERFGPRSGIVLGGFVAGLATLTVVLVRTPRRPMAVVAGAARSLSASLAASFSAGR